MGVVTPTTPTVSDQVAITTVALNGVNRSTFDLRTKWGAWLSIMLGRGGTTALTNGVDVRVRRTHNNDAERTPGALVAFRSQSAACNSTTCAASGNNAGVTSLTVASTTSFAAGDLICIQDNATPTSLTEWAYVSRVTSATVLLLDAPTKNAHNSTSHTVRNKADVWSPIWVPGGGVYELIVDYGDDSAGESVTLKADIETFDSVTVP